MSPQTSPVNAPCGEKYRFCAPSCTADPRIVAATPLRYGNAGQTKTSTAAIGYLTANAWLSEVPASASRFIFQLPATRIRRMQTNLSKYGDRQHTNSAAGEVVPSLATDRRCRPGRARNE